MENKYLITETILQGFAFDCFKVFNEQSKPTIPELKDNLTKDEALKFLSDNAYPLSSSTFYQKTALNEIPCRRIGKRLLFSRKELMQFIEDKAISKVNPTTEAARNLAIQANKKEARKL